MKTFLEKWDTVYQAALRTILLFNSSETAKWSKEQQQLFIKLLYHQRGHFDDILWCVGNFAPDAQSKEMVVKNIREEFGGYAPSHEKLYLDFAKSHGVDLTYEMIDETMYLPFLRTFNKELLRWLRTHDWDHCITAFAAIERLDNLDYPALKGVAESIETHDKDMIFFNVHIHVTHYDIIEQSGFADLWKRRPEIVESVFQFIADYYLDTWRHISDYVFAYAGEGAVVEAA